MLFTTALISRRNNILEDKNVTCETRYFSSFFHGVNKSYANPKVDSHNRTQRYTILCTILNPETHRGNKQVASQKKRGQSLSPKYSQKCFALFLELSQNCEKR
jgi:hypothetical protein